MEIIPSLSQLETVQHKNYTMLPVVLKASAVPGDRLALFNKLFPSGERFIFESGQNGRYTIMGGQPGKVWRNDYAGLHEYMKEHRSPVIDGLPKCAGGVVGLFSYDFAWSLETLPQRDEIFMTNSVQGIMPVSEVVGVWRPVATTHEKTKKMLAIYNQAAAMGLRTMHDWEVQ